MRIAIVAGPYYPVPPINYGGSERVIYYLIKGLKEQGHEPILLGPGDSAVDCEVVPIVKKALYFPKRDSLRFKVTVNQALERTAKLIEKIAPQVDIVHSHDFDLKPFKYFPNITTLHGHIGFENLSFFHERRDLPYVSISKNQQAAYPNLNYMGVAYNGQDPAEFPFVAKPQNYLAFLGRFDWDKSPHLAIDLALSLGMKIKLAGKIDLEGADYFKKHIKPYLSHPLVEFLGELNSKARTELLSKAKLNLHPLLGRREPFGLTVIEAAYSGTPTLAMSRASMIELIEHGKSGILVEDFVEGYHRIQEAFDLDRHQVSERARKLFNYQSMTKQYIKSYKKAIMYHRRSGDKKKPVSTGRIMRTNFTYLTRKGK